MRLLLIIAAATIAATPVHAAPGDGDDVVGSLPSREQIDRATEQADGAAGALMDVRVGGVIAALNPDPDADLRRDDTLGDLAWRDDPRGEEKMHRKIRMVGMGMNALMDRVAVIAPEMERSFHDMKRSFKRALRSAPPRD